MRIKNAYVIYRKKKLKSEVLLFSWMWILLLLLLSPSSVFIHSVREHLIALRSTFPHFVYRKYSKFVEDHRRCSNGGFWRRMPLRNDQSQTCTDFCKWIITVHDYSLLFCCNLRGYLIFSTNTTTEERVRCVVASCYSHAVIDTKWWIDIDGFISIYL